MSTKLFLWSRAVKDRDGRCMKCGSIENLHAHHIKPKSIYPDLILDIDNGLTLCYGCHKSEHEKNRPTRIGKRLPQRKTLMKRISELLRLFY